MIKLLEKSSNHRSLKQTIQLLAFSTLIILASCAKDPGQIGYVLQPEDSKLHVFISDTTSLYGYSVTRDSIRSSTLSETGLGALNDPVFGSTLAGFYTEFMLSSPGEDFEEGSTVDSLILQLVYGSAYGDTNTLLHAHTYEMFRNLDNDSIYYSNLQVPIGDIDYSNHSFYPRPNDSIIVDGDTLAAMLRINLSNISLDLANKLLNASAEDMESSSAFQEYFNGIFVQAEPVNGDGSIAFFDLSDAKSKMTLYYTNDTNSLSYEYLITTAAAFAGKYEHNRLTASPEFKSQVINGDTSLGQINYYVQGFGGVESILRFPHIFNWARKGNVAVNEAKLILPASDGDQFFNAPSQLSLLKIESDTSYATLDDQTEGEAYFDGYYNDDLNQYEFRISRYIQSMISDTTQSNYGLLLYVYGGSFYPNSLILKGNNQGADTTGIRLELLYTEL